MASRDKEASAARIAREIERERIERSQHDEARAGLAPPQDFRTKDARESADSGKLKRHRGR